MNKILLISVAASALLTSSALSALTLEEKFEALQAQMMEMKKELDALKQKELKAELSEETKEDIDDMKETIAELNKATSGNHLKFGIDYRFAVENMHYKMADGTKEKNDGFMTNRLFVNMDWLATKNLSFAAQLAYNKAFGARSGSQGNPANAYETFDWIANENAYDDSLRVRSAYFLYRNNTFLGNEIPWTFSVGRRPSTNGHLVNMRDDDKAASPMGHSINVEFDGLSSKFGLEKLTGVDGMYIKFCAGRGMSDAAPKFASTPYSKVDTLSGANPDIDLGGFIFVPYNNGHYGVATQYYYASNLIDASPFGGFDTVGGLHSFTANFTLNGIGDGINDYLDDTNLFISGAVSKTDPKNGQAMLGSQIDESVTGYSYWIGAQMPSLFTEDGRWGVEFNHGSNFWRGITYGEDTNIGSKLAARGDAYEAYFTEYLVDDILSMQLRYTYIDYAYTGSNGFFGNTTGTSMSMDQAVAFGMGGNYVDKAQDIRFYLRYKY